MPDQQEIKSEKIVVKEIFSNMWFRIPEYQRPYIWTRDEVNDLLDDLTFAMSEKPDNQYFLGSFVYALCLHPRSFRRRFRARELREIAFPKG